MKGANPATPPQTSCFNPNIRRGLLEALKLRLAHQPCQPECSFQDQAHQKHTQKYPLGRSFQELKPEPYNSSCQNNPKP